MAKVYGPPSGLVVPDMTTYRDAQGNYDIESCQKAEADFLESIRQYARSENPKDTLAGAVGYFPMGDGCAIYVVFRRSPLQVIHVPIGDAWRLPAYSERGIRAADFGARSPSRERAGGVR